MVESRSKNKDLSSKLEAAVGIRVEGGAYSLYFCSSVDFSSQGSEVTHCEEGTPSSSNVPKALEKLIERSQSLGSFQLYITHSLKKTSWSFAYCSTYFLKLLS